MRQKWMLLCTPRVVSTVYDLFQFYGSPNVTRVYTFDRFMLQAIVRLADQTSALRLSDKVGVKSESNG